MAGGLSVIQDRNRAQSKTRINIWKLRDVYDKPESDIKQFLSATESRSNLLHPQASCSSFKEESIDGLISARARLDLSRAAKRAVLKQQQLYLQGDIQYKRRHLTTSNSNRKRQPKHIREGPRSEVYSAPPHLGSLMKEEYQSPISPPKIVVISASQNGSQKSDLFGSPSPTLRSPTYENHWKEKQASYGQATDFSPRSVMSTDSSTFLGAYSPDGKLHDYGHRTCYSETPRSNLSSSDWTWVRERLTSRESMLDRPESSLTFYDFLESLNPESDEYDTDLEDNFEPLNLDDDRTGLTRYNKICDEKGIAPAKQVIKKLSNEDVTFELSHRYLNNQDTRAIAAALSSNSFIEKVNLAGNHIDDEAAKSIFGMLRRNTIIKRMDLSNNSMKSDDQGVISNALRENSTLTHLSLSQNKLGDKEALLLSNALNCNSSLEYLNVSHNQFSDSGGQAIAAALMDNSVLTSLDLSWNMLGKHAASALGKALKVNKTLQSLDLSYNGFGDEGAALFGRPLRHNNSLRYLSLAVNHIGTFGADRLAAAICGHRKKGGKKSKCVLKSLNLSRNPLGKKSIVVLLKHMEQTGKLRDLRVDEVVLALDCLSLIKQLNSSRDVAVFYEGQDEQDKQYCAIRLGRLNLQEIMIRNRVLLGNFFKSIDRDNTGVSTNVLKKCLEELNSPPSEIELDRLIYCLDTRKTNTIRYDDIIKTKKTSVTFCTPQEITRKRK